MELQMDDMRSLKAIQLDALREVANIGAGHAATALSQMINSPIMISVPTINVWGREEVPPQISAPEEPVAAVLMHMLGDLTGRTLLVFPKPTAVRLAALILPGPQGPPPAPGRDAPRRRAGRADAAASAGLVHRPRRDGAVGDQGSGQHPQQLLHE